MPRTPWLVLIALAVALPIAPSCSSSEQPEHGEHGESRCEHVGEHGESGEGEESGRRLGKSEVWDETRNGARLILAYDPASQSFKGTVQNNTLLPMSRVRVEVHLSNGVELGPTTPTDLAHGEKIPIELPALGQEFEWWTAHPEQGRDEHRGEHD